MLRGTQTIAPRFRATAAEWSIKQLGIQEKDHAPELYRRRSADAPEDAQAGPASKPPGKKPGARGGGGGAYRAYMHVMHAGRRLTAESIRQATDEYHSLSPEEHARYNRLGQLGNLAWRAGHRSFGDRARAAGSASAGQAGLAAAGLQDASGAWVQEDAQDAAQVALVPVATRDFQEDLRAIRRQFALARKEARSEEEDTEKRRQEHEQELLRSLPAVLPDVPNSSLCGSAQAGFRHLQGQARWFPPCPAVAAR